MGIESGTHDAKVTPSSAMSVTFGNAWMTYIQFMLMADNYSLLNETLGTAEGQIDFLDSRDMMGNTSLHYVAMLGSLNSIKVTLSKM